MNNMNMELRSFNELHPHEVNMLTFLTMDLIGQNLGLATRLLVVA